MRQYGNLVFVQFETHIDVLRVDIAQQTVCPNMLTFERSRVPHFDFSPACSTLFVECDSYIYRVPVDQGVFDDAGDSYSFTKLQTAEFMEIDCPADCLLCVDAGVVVLCRNRLTLLDYGLNEVFAQQFKQNVVSVHEMPQRTLLCVQEDGFLFTCSQNGLSSQSTLGFAPRLVCASAEFGCALAFGEQKLTLLQYRNGKLSQTGPLSLSAEIVGMSFGHYRDEHSEQFEPLALLLVNVDQSLQLVAMPASRFNFQAATDLDVGLELPLQADSVSYCALDDQYMHCQFQHNGRPFLSSSIVLF